MANGNVNPSGDIANALNDIQSAQSDTLNLVKDLIGAISGASSGIGSVISVVTMLMNLGKPDQVQLALQRIQDTIEIDFRKLNQELSAQQILERNTTLNGYIAPAL